MHQPIIVLSPESMPMEQPFLQRYQFTNTFNTDAIRQAGGMPVTPSFLTQPEADELLQWADGLFLTGGGDISPALYGQETCTALEEFDAERDRTDYCLLRAALRFHKPVFCICRGFQLVNVFFGGSLWQDLPTQRPGPAAHNLWTWPDYARPAAHRVTLVPGTPLHRLLGTDSLPVNSLHHQAICTLASNLRPMAFSEDGLVEGWYLPDDAQWLRGIQWHPEMLAPNHCSQAIFAQFIAACQG